MRVAVITFPGSNCDVDALRALGWLDGVHAQAVWHDATSLAAFDAVVLPGGFSYGDYLRCGAMAAVSPVLGAVRELAARGGLVLGICNGFQVLCEAGLLSGALVRNDHLQFRCELVDVVVQRTDTPFTAACTRGQVLRLPIAHGEGNYVADAATIASIEQRGGVLLRYGGTNPNGSTNAIAGIVSEAGNVLGMMPHPERAMRAWMGSADGRDLFHSMLRWHAAAAVATGAAGVGTSPGAPTLTVMGRETPRALTHA